MYHNKIYDNRGFSHILVVCGVFFCIVIGLAGYRVYSATNKSVKTETTSISNTEQAKGQPKQSESILPHTAIPTVPASTPPKPKAAPAPKPALAPAFTTSIQIKGDATCKTSTLDALKLLSTNAPAHYATVSAYISVIECASQGSGMFAYENSPRYLEGDATRNAGTVWYAGTIAHDAGHSKLYRNYLSSHAGQPVPDDVWIGESAERTCLEAQYDTLTKIGGTQSQLDYVQNVINSQYYDVPYDQRWW